MPEKSPSIGKAGKTYFGDCKMASLETRAYLASSHDYYVCPLSGTQVDAAELDELLKPVFGGTQTLTEITRPAASEDEPPEVIARGYEFSVQLTAKVGDKEIIWTERRFVICSLAHQRQQQTRLKERAEEALRDISSLGERKKGKKRLSRPELLQKIERILKRKDLAGLIDVEVITTTKERKKRKYKDREAYVEVVETHVVKVSVNQEALQAALRRCGWRVYVSNHPDLTQQEVVLGYRGQYVLEGGYDRLKNQPLGLRPLYLQKEERVVGLVHLLSVGLRVLTLVEFVARRNLQKSGEKLQNVYAGQPGRKTARPSAELLLRAFKGINLYVEQHDHGTEAAIKPLSPVQQRILALLELPADLYSRLSTHSNQPLLI